VCLVPRQRLRLHINPTVIVVALVVTAIDAVTKSWVRSVLATRDIHVGGAVWLKLQYNSGISFSFNRSGPMVTTIVTVIISVIVLAVGLNASPGVATAGFGLLIGGGIANVIDRLAANPHQVTDFIAIGSFPVFNLADVSITAGFVVLVVGALQGERMLAR
jgi:signal peptidase II